MNLTSLFCKVGLHRWKKGRRIRGFRVRRCKACSARAEEHFPGGGWRVVTPAKRIRKARALHMVTATEEQKLDQLRELRPL